MLAVRLRGGQDRQGEEALPRVPLPPAVSLLRPPLLLLLSRQAHSDDAHRRAAVSVRALLHVLLRREAAEAPRGRGARQGAQVRL